ncbi:hypothetical protein Trydic_g14814 [Trypoxylus dichotomus]
MDTLRYIAALFLPDITQHFKHCLRTNYFVWDGSFYEQTDGVAMGRPLSLVVANLFMERFKNLAIETAVDKPTVWWKYVDDTLVVWPHGRDKLDRFLKHLNGARSNIQFIMQVEYNGVLHFLDVLVTGTKHRQQLVCLRNHIPYIPTVIYTIILTTTVVRRIRWCVR